jgi:hypothetical protein
MLTAVRAADQRLPREDGMASPERRERAPELQEGLDWLNVERPLTLRELRGKLVLLDFWTYG